MVAFGKPNVFEHLTTLFVDRSCTIEAPPDRERFALRAKDSTADVLEHSQLRKHIGNLKTSRQTQTAQFKRSKPFDGTLVQENLTAGRAHPSADRIEDCGFSRAVRTDDGMALTLNYIQR